MHITFAQIERMSLVELDDLRHQLRLTKKALCEAGELDPSTYTRWMKHVRGQGGCAPQPRSLKTIRNVLAAHVGALQPEAAQHSPSHAA